MQTQPALTAHSAGKPAAAEPQLQAIPPTLVADVWPLITEHIDSVVVRSRGRYSRKGVVERLLSGDWLLWLVWDGSIKGVLATELYYDVSGDKVCSIRFCTGADAKAWVHLIDHIENAFLTATDYSALAAAKNYSVGVFELRTYTTEAGRLPNLNARFRDRDRSTNVLSFPAPESAAPHLGDLVLAYDLARRCMAVVRRSFRQPAGA